MRKLYVCFLLLSFLFINGCTKETKSTDTNIEEVEATVSTDSWEEIAGEYLDLYLENGWYINPLAAEDDEEVVTFRPDTSEHAQRQLLQVSPILQNPELPTGCEVTSLAQVLNYLGYQVDKLTLADKYLDKGAVGSDFRKVFVGNPRNKNGYGCYASVIVNCANKYLQEENSSMAAYNYTGSSFESLLSELDIGYPVIIWVTIDLAKPYSAKSWTTAEGEKITWLAQEHCVVLKGYDMEKKIVYVADPLRGDKEYDYELFKTRYEQLLQQAVILKWAG